jgi:hypothetical protein
MVHTYTLEVDEHDGLIYLLMPPVNTISKVEFWDGSAWVELTAVTEYTVYGLNEQAVAVSTSYQRVRIHYSTTAYSSYDLNTSIQDLISIMYDNRPNNKQEREAVVKEIAKYKIWRAE